SGPRRGLRAGGAGLSAAGWRGGCSPAVVPVAGVSARREGVPASLSVTSAPPAASSTCIPALRALRAPGRMRTIHRRYAMFEKFSRSWDLVKASASVLRSDKELMLFPVISGIATLVVLATFLLPMFALRIFAEGIGL